MSDQSVSARTVMEHVAEYFQPEKAAGFDAVVQYVLTGEDGGEWYMAIGNGTCSVAEGRTDNARVTITMDAADYVELTTGRLDGIRAFMQGKIRLAGDFALATRLTTFFRTP